MPPLSDLVVALALQLGKQHAEPGAELLVLADLPPPSGVSLNQPQLHPPRHAHPAGAKAVRDRRARVGRQPAA
jgi:hypothetical protein